MSRLTDIIPSRYHQHSLLYSQEKQQPPVQVRFPHPFLFYISSFQLIFFNLLDTHHLRAVWYLGLQTQSQAAAANPPSFTISRSSDHECRLEFPFPILFYTSCSQLDIYFFQLNCYTPCMGHLISLPADTIPGHCPQHPLFHSQEKQWVQAQVRILLSYLFSRSFL